MPQSRSKSGGAALYGWLVWAWNQLTSMRTALVLLLLLAVAAVPGSLVPQRSSDPNGVIKFVRENPHLVDIFNFFQLFSVYTSFWFSAIYILLFISLIGCLIPRLWRHAKAFRARPPKTPKRLERMPSFWALTTNASDEDILSRAKKQLKSSGYRLNIQDKSISAERGWLRESGNIIFHLALLVILIGVGLGGAYGYTGQRLLVVGSSYANTVGDLDTFHPGRLLNPNALPAYRVSLNSFEVKYDSHPQNPKNLGHVLDYDARVTINYANGSSHPGQIKVNHPLRIGGDSLYLIGNGYAPTIRVLDPKGREVYQKSVPFLPQNSEMTSLGVIKIPDGLKEQLGLIGVFYPTVSSNQRPYFSVFPGLNFPLLTLKAYIGDLRLNDGQPQSVYALNTDGMREIAGGKTNEIELMPGQSAELPDGLGRVEFVNAHPSPNSFDKSVPRYISIDIHHDPAKLWVLGAVIALFTGLFLGLFVPRRRIWVKVTENQVEIAGLARGDDPGLDRAVKSLVWALGLDPESTKTGQKLS